MALDLHLGTAQRGQQHHGQQFAGLAVHAVTAHVIAEAQLGEHARHELGEVAGQPRVPILDLRAVQRRLQLKPALVAVLLAHRALLGQRQFDAGGLERLVHGADGVQRLREADERRALVDGLADLDRRAADVQGRLRMRFQLRQRVERGQHGDGHQFAHAVVQAAGVADIAEDEPLQDAHELRIGAFRGDGRLMEQLLHRGFGAFDSIHCYSLSFDSSLVSWTYPFPPSEERRCDVSVPDDTDVAPGPPMSGYHCDHARRAWPHHRVHDPFNVRSAGLQCAGIPQRRPQPGSTSAPASR